MVPSTGLDEVPNGNLPLRVIHREVDESLAFKSFERRRSFTMESDGGGGGGELVGNIPQGLTRRGIHQPSPPSIYSLIFLSTITKLKKAENLFDWFFFCFMILFYLTKMKKLKKIIFSLNILQCLPRLVQLTSFSPDSLVQ